MSALNSRSRNWGALLACSLVLLALAAVPASGQGKEWTSGEIVSRDTFLYGAFETRVKASKGTGAITGFIIIIPNSEKGPWQELALEFFGKGDGRDYQSQIITPGPPEADVGALPRAQHMVQHKADSSLWDNFHTARIEWSPDRLTFIMDGKTVREETDTSKYAQFFDKSKVAPMQIRLDLWAGYSDWSGQVNPSSPPTSASFEYMKYEKWDGGKFVPDWEDTFDTVDTSRWQVADWTFPFAVNDFSPNNVVSEDGNLVIKFTK